MSMNWGIRTGGLLQAIRERGLHVGASPKVMVLPNDSPQEAQELIPEQWLPPGSP